MRAFYNPQEFECLLPIVNNIDIIVREINDNRKDDLLNNYVNDSSSADWQRKESVTGEWKAAQIYARDAESSFVRPEKEYEEWMKYSQLAPEIFPKTYKHLKSINEIYRCGISMVSPGCEIKPHNHTFDKPTLIFQVCLTPSSGRCVLTVGDEEVAWKTMKQTIMFDGNFVHSLKNDSPDARTILHIEFDPSCHVDYIWPYSDRKKK